MCVCCFCVFSGIWLSRSDDNVVVFIYMSSCKIPDYIAGNIGQGVVSHGGICGLYYSGRVFQVCAPVTWGKRILVRAESAVVGGGFKGEILKYDSAGEGIQGLTNGSNTFFKAHELDMLAVARLR